MADENSQDNKIKVTDKRMFTADGELREGFRDLDSAPAEPAVEPTEPEPTPQPEPPADVGPAASESPMADAEPSGGARVELPHMPGAQPAPGFFDLVSALAEPITIYLGDAELPDGTSAENLEAARFYIDLLEVLRTKTAGNLSSQEASVLEDLLYQLRVRYVRKQG